MPPDTVAFRPCVGPMTHTGLTAGIQWFGVRAVDTLGNRDGSPAFTHATVSRPQAYDGSVLLG